MRNPLKKRLLGAGLVLAVCLLFSLDASAINREKLIQMSKIGLGDQEIIVLIDSSKPGELSFTEDELAELRLQGVSDKVIDHLRTSGHVVQTALPAPADTPTPAPATDLPAPAGDLVAPTGDLVAPGAIAPAPAEGDSQQVMTKEQLEAEMAKRLQKERARSTQQAKIRQLSAQIPKANKLLSDGENMAAAKIFLEILSYEPEKKSPAWYESNFGVGKALFNEKIYSGASQPIFDIVREGPDGAHFKEAFNMLETITREIGFQPPEIEELSALYLGNMNADFQSNFNFYMGRFFYDYNRSEQAIEYFKKVDAKSPKYAEARYLEGAAKLDVNDITGALRDFQEAIESAEKEEGDNSDILQLSYLALARTFYEAGFYDVALFYYQKLPKKSSRNAESMLEQAWAYFLMNNYKHALGIFHTLHSPYYSKWYYPDLYILESTVYLNLCMFEKAKRALDQFNIDYIAEKPRLDAFIASTTSPTVYWKTMMSTFKQPKETAKIPRIFANAILDDLQFYNQYKEIQRLAKEERTLKANLKALGNFGQTVLASVKKQLTAKVEDGGILVQQKLQQLSQQLSDWEIKATQISFDIDSEDKERLEASLVNQEQVKEPTKQSGTTFRVVADDWQQWPFEGEYWLDEVTSYRSGIKSQCEDR